MFEWLWDDSFVFCISLLKKYPLFVLDSLMSETLTYP